MQTFISAVHPIGVPVEALEIGERLLDRFDMLGVLVCLEQDHGLLDTLGEIDAVKGRGTGFARLVAFEFDITALEKDLGIGMGLFNDQVAQVEQERIAGDVVEPVDDEEIIPAAAIAPE